MKNYEKIENTNMRTEVVSLPIAKLRRFKNHPYKVIDNEEMASLVDSIYNQGILTPITVCPLTNGEYEIVSGHRRVFACKKLGIEKIPAFVKELTRDEAIVIMTDSNLHRDGLLPSEKAFAYKMKLDTIKRQGERTDLTSDQNGQKSLTSVERIAIENDESKTQVQRYISLTRLIPEFLQTVDDGKMALTPAVEISKIPKDVQYDLYEVCSIEDCLPSYSQTVRMRKLFDYGSLNRDAMLEIMSEEKANQKDRIVIYNGRSKTVLPKKYVAEANRGGYFGTTEETAKKQDESGR